MSTDYEKAVDALMKDVKDLRSDMKGILSALHGKATDRVESIKESLHDSAAERVGQVRDAACAVGQSCQNALNDCAEKIAKRPFVSVLAAVGAGVILGGLLLRRRP
jgi:ElaB/YqjD/DUF883 family membrane-anchored ribosome-binding protein